MAYIDLYQYQKAKNLLTNEKIDMFEFGNHLLKHAFRMLEARPRWRLKMHLYGLFRNIMLPFADEFKDQHIYKPEGYFESKMTAQGNLIFSTTELWEKCVIKEKINCPPRPKRTKATFNQHGNLIFQDDSSDDPESTSAKPTDEKATQVIQLE